MRQSHVRSGITHLPPQHRVLPFCMTCATIKFTVAPMPRRLHLKPTEPFERSRWDFRQDNEVPPYKAMSIHVVLSTKPLRLWLSLCFRRSRTSSTACLRTMASARGFRLQSVRLDNDSAFRIHDFIAACDESSDAREYAAHYSQFQNGLIERTWHTLSTWAHCMPDHASLGADCWEFAIAVAVYIHNRTFRRGVKDTPLRLMTGATPDLSYLRTFGYLAFVHAPRANRSKTTPSAHEGIFVGYSHDSPTLLVWMPDTRVVLATRNVAFHE